MAHAAEKDDAASRTPKRAVLMYIESMRRESVPIVRFRHAAQLAALCALISVSVAQWIERTAPFHGAEGWRQPFVGAVLALERPASTVEMKQLLLGVSEAARSNTEADFWFILAYGLFFISLAFVHYRQRAPFSSVLGTATIVLAVVTMVFDLIENQFIFSNIERIAANTKISLAIITIAAVKWAAFFSVTLLAAPIFARRMDWALAVAAGLTFFSSLGLVGCVGLAMTISSRAVIAVATKSVLLFMALGVAFFAARPSRLLPTMADGESAAAETGYIASPAGRNRPATSGPQTP
jgi:hypothetical protein